MSRETVNRVRNFFSWRNESPPIRDCVVTEIQCPSGTYGVTRELASYNSHLTAERHQAFDKWSEQDDRSPEASDWWLYTEPSIGLLEFFSIPHGMKSCDQMLKASPVHLLEATTICPGKFLVAVGGDSVTVEYAMNKGKSIAQDWLADSLYIPNVDRKVLTALAGLPAPANFDTIGVVETSSVAAGIIAADAVAKSTNVSFLLFRLAKELGGKAFFVTAGDLGEVEAALETVEAVIAEPGKLLSAMAIPVPDEALLKKMGLGYFAQAKHAKSGR